MALSAILTALIPTVLPEIIKQIKTKPGSGVKEISGGGIVGALYFISQDVESCALEGFNALSCVPVDHWSMLLVSGLALFARLNGKRKEN